MLYKNRFYNDIHLLGLVQAALEYYGKPINAKDLVNFYANTTKYFWVKALDNLKVKKLIVYGSYVQWVKFEALKLDKAKVVEGISIGINYFK